MLSDRNKYILAIDLGTSALKAALVTVDGEVVGYETVPMRVTLLPDGGAEQAPAEWWEGFLSAAKSLLQKNSALARDVIAVCCTTQWSGTVPVDREGHPLTDAIIWMDSRGGRYVKQITGGWPSIHGYGVTKLWTWLRLTAGIPAHSGKDPIAHILYLKHERPEIYAQTYKFLEPKDYFNLCLTGRFAASFESITLHWVTDNRGISKVAYDRQLLKLAGIERDKLPELKLAVDILGPLKPEIARELGLPENTPVVMGTPDVHSAAIGSGAVRDFEPHLYVGTSSWLTCHVPFKKTDITCNMASLP